MDPLIARTVEELPTRFNAATDLLAPNLVAGRGGKVAVIDHNVPALVEIPRTSDAMHRIKCGRSRLSTLRCSRLTNVPRTETPLLLTAGVAPNASASVRTGIGSLPPATVPSPSLGWPDSGAFSPRTGDASGVDQRRGSISVVIRAALITALTDRKNGPMSTPALSPEWSADHTSYRTNCGRTDWMNGLHRPTAGERSPDDMPRRARPPMAPNELDYTR
jgi:hypothetical protein